MDSKPESAEAMTKPSMSLAQCVLYAAPVAAFSLMTGAMNIAQALYAKYFGLSLATIATVLLLSRIFDAFTDPLIGTLSDRYQTYHGTRKPFIIAGALLFVISAYFLFIPGEFAPLTSIDPTDTDSRQVSAIYFVLALFAFYLAWTLFDIPHLAWASEISPSGEDKNRIYIMRSAAATFGLLLFYLLPFLPLFETRDITPQTLQWAVILGASLVIPLLYLLIERVPNGPRLEVPIKKPRIGIKQLLTTLVGNRPFLFFFLAIAFATIGCGMVGSMLFFYVDAYLGIGEQFASLSLISWLFSFLSLWFSLKMFSRIGKRASWVVLLSLAGVCLLILPLLKPGGDNFMTVVVVKILFNIAFSAIWALANSQLSHIIDYDTWKTGEDRAATYFAIHMFDIKATMAIGMALGLAVASWFGFDPAVRSHSELSIFGLHLSLVYLPGLAFFLAIGLFLLNSLTERRNQVIRRRLDRRLAQVQSQV